MNTMTENITPIELSEQDQLDLEAMGVVPDDAPAEVKRTLLEIWNAIFDSLEANEAERISPETAVRVTQMWPLLTIQDVPLYHERYFARLRELRTTLHMFVADFPEALEHTEDDAEKNGDIYTGLLIDWQVRIQDWQLAWDVSEPTSHVQLAADADALNFTVGQHGMANHLSEIGFDFSEERQGRIVEALDDAKNMTLARLAAEAGL